MKVTEKDIFNFVFFTDLVREEIKSFLYSIEGSNDEIAFYKELKNSIAEELRQNLKLKLFNKIIFNNMDNVIQLYPVEEVKKKSLGTVLAAASLEETPKIITRTFYDYEKSFIIKVINYEKHSKIFVFSTQQEVLKNFDIVIQPQNQRFHIHDNLIPLELDFQINADSIKLEFNLISY